MPKRRGADARLHITPYLNGVLLEGNATFVGFQRFEVTDRTTALPVTDSELRPGNFAYDQASAGNGPFDDTLTGDLLSFRTPARDAFVAKIGDLREGMIRFVNTTWSEEDNLFGPPLVLHSGKFYKVVFTPVREEIDTDLVFNLGNLLCVSAGHTAIIPGAQPTNIEFETDGSFRFPKELAELA